MLRIGFKAGRFLYLSKIKIVMTFLTSDSITCNRLPPKKYSKMALLTLKKVSKPSFSEKIAEYPVVSPKIGRCLLISKI